MSTTGDDSELRKVSLGGLAVVVTAGTWLRIILRWGSYDWLTRSGAVVFLTSLIIVALAIWRMKITKGTIDPWQLAMMAYLWLALATAIFGR